MLNVVHIIGRLGQNPEAKYTGAGSPVCNLRIATDESYTDRDGNKVEQTEWHSVTVFGRQAENCSSRLKKGSLVYVEGSLQTRRYTDKNGTARNITSINAKKIKFLGGIGEKNEQRTGNEYNDLNHGSAIDDIPF